jgi:hypothetical protein
LHGHLAEARTTAWFHARVHGATVMEMGNGIGTPLFAT